VANNERAQSKTGLLTAVSVVALIGWGVAGYEFWSWSNDRDAAAAQLRQAEVVRQGVASKFDELQKAAGTLGDVQAKITDVKKQLDDATARRDEADQHYRMLQQQSDDLKTAVSAAATARDHVQGELQQVQQAVSDAQAKLDALRTQAEANLKQAQDATAAAVKQVTDSRANLDAARQELAEAVQAQKALTTKIAQAESVIAVAADRRTQLEAGALRSDAKAVEIAATLGPLEFEVQNATTALTDVQAQLQTAQQAARYGPGEVRRRAERRRTGGATRAGRRCGGEEGGGRCGRGGAAGGAEGDGCPAAGCRSPQAGQRC
jgi:chromosome segregation ATPase